MKKRLLVLISLLLIFSSISNAQTTLQNLKAYAKNNIEYPEYDNKDLLNPDYTTFHKAQIQGFLGRTWNGFLRLVGVKRKEIGTIYDLSELLDKLSKDKEQGDFIYKFTPKIRSKFVIWGDLHGAFHSLIRDLEKLNELKIIDNDLKIADGYYFVFNGNVVDRSPYIIETLCVVLTLIEKNPNKVFYFRGDHENKNTWQDYGLKREIEIKGKSSSTTKLIEKIDSYFNTLPIALFLGVKDKSNFVCITPYQLEKHNLKESLFAKFLNGKTSNQAKKFNLSKAEPSKDFVNIDAIVENIDRSKYYLPSKGLLQIPPDLGATAWSVFSSPTISSQKNYSFFYDSFAIVEVGKDIYNWKISNYYQDVRAKKGFENKSYYLVSGQSSNKPPCIGKINVGCTLDLSEGAPKQVRQEVEGLFLGINKENKRGGINGKYIRLILLNDKYNPELAKKSVEILLSRYKTDIVLAPNGSQTLKAYIDLVKHKKIIVLFPMTGGEMFRRQNLPNIVNFRASYLREGKAIMEYALKKMKPKKIVLFYQYDEYGRSVLKGAKQVLENFNNIKVLVIPYLRDENDFQVQTEKISSFKPDTIMLCSTSIAAQILIRQLDTKTIKNIKNVLGVSDHAGEEFKSFIGRIGVNYVFTQAVPDTNNNNLEIIKKYRKESKENGYIPNIFSLEAYIDTEIFVDVLKKIKGKITKEKIIQKLEGIKNYDFAGLKLNFDSKTRSLAKDIWIDTGKKKILWKG